jgi:hypothetical protein
VGPFDQSPGVQSGVATWTGSSWSAQTDPAAALDQPVLRQVSCASSSFCMAVGQSYDTTAFAPITLTERWNGAAWSLVDSPNGILSDNTLHSVSCPAVSFCLAVGTSSTPGTAVTSTLAEAWNGASWSVVSNPLTGADLNLMEVSCASPSFCLSVGFGPGGGPFGLVADQLLWGGSAWSVPDIAASPPPVAALACVSASFCMAASNNSFSQWNGSTWSALPVAASSEDDAVAALTCTSPSFCLAVGSRDGHETGYESQTLAKEWNGTAWSYVPTADATTLANNDLADVSCTDSACTAVGTALDPDNGATSGLIEASSLTSGVASASGPVSAPIVGMAATPDGNGYWLVGSDGAIYNYGDAVLYGSLRGTHLNQPIVGMAATPDGGGYWMVASDGGIFSFGDAHFFGSTGSLHLNQPVVGMTTSPDGQGYWFVASDGGIFAFGDAQFLGSMGGTPLNAPVVGMAVDNLTRGYWLVAADGGIFSFKAPFYGSTGALHLNKPIVGMESDPGGGGYRFVASDGGVFSMNLPFSGSAGATHLNQPVVGLGTTGAVGYWLVARDGGIFTFGGAAFLGSPA